MIETATFVILLAGILLGISFTLACLITVIIKVFKES